MALLTQQHELELVVDHSISDDESRMRFVTETKHDAWLAPLIAAPMPIDLDNCGRNVRAVPLLEPTGLMGALVIETDQPLTTEQRQTLDAAAVYAATRLVQLGVTAVPDPAPLKQLTFHQHRVMHLASDGLTNREIAEQLDISPNTVKKHLKTIFAKLDVSTRTELANVRARFSVRDPAPFGTSRKGDLYITRRYPTG
ncbi:MAG: LuxR C-terminal-related transcriptional regulator [Kofleriaceae bacterium]